MHEIAAFYRFAPVTDPAARRAPLLDACRAAGAVGSILLAPEGVNGTIAAPEGRIGAVLDHLRGWPGFDGLTARMSRAEDAPFGRMKVRLKREIVTLGQPGIDTHTGGTRIDPEDWNAVMADPDTVTIDMRNAYEIAIGSFAGAVDPGTRSFGEIPDWWRAHRDGLAGKRIAMFCTGGIRCEKAGALLVADGAEVVQLSGGILGYLEAVAPERSLWRGECFVFDDRVALIHGLAPGRATLCHGCRAPLMPGDRAHPAYEEGVRCHRCAGRRADGDLDRLRERRRQVTLAAERNARHLGREAGEGRPAGFKPA